MVGSMTRIADPAAILVDLQRYFCTAEYRYVDERGAERIAKAVETINDFLARYRESGRAPIFVRTTHDPRTNSPVWNDKYGDASTPCRPDSAEAAFHPNLNVRDDDVIVTKHRYDAFHGTDLETYLSANDVSELLVGGVATHVCVETAMRSAFDRDYRATVLADCTEAADPDARDRSLDRIDRLFGTVSRSTSVDLEAVNLP